MIAHSIIAAQRSNLFDAVIVSTEDQEISQVATKYGASLPFKRPDSLADDFATTGAVMADAVKTLTEQGWKFDAVCCLYATAPFVEPDDLREAYKKLVEADVDYVFSVTSYAYPIQRALRMDGDGRIAMFQPEHMATRSQDLEPAYHDAAQFYWGRKDSWQLSKPIFSERSIPWVLPRNRVQDIDTIEDWIQAENIYMSHQ
jgi:pseudaminic acid cytidylyltransferase